MPRNQAILPLRTRVEDDDLTTEMCRAVVERAMQLGPDADTPFLAPMFEEPRLAAVRADHDAARAAGSHEYTKCHWCRITWSVARAAREAVELARSGKVADDAS